jgi:hypothetical protein
VPNSTVWQQNKPSAPSCVGSGGEAPRTRGRLREDDPGRGERVWSNAEDEYELGGEDGTKDGDGTEEARRTAETETETGEEWGWSQGEGAE